MINATVVFRYDGLVQCAPSMPKTTYLLTMRFSFHHTIKLTIQNKNLYSYHTLASLLLPSHSYLLPINSEWSMVMPKSFSTIHCRWPIFIYVYDSSFYQWMALDASLHGEVMERSVFIFEKPAAFRYIY